MMPLKRIFRDIMSHTPMFVRRALTKQKIHQMTSFMMSLEEVMRCDQDPNYKADLVEVYKRRYLKKTDWLEKKIKRALVTYPKLKSLDESARLDIKSEMEYAFFGYGFYPDEFLFFDLGGG